MDRGVQLSDLTFLRSQFRSARGSKSFIPTMESWSISLPIKSANQIRQKIVMHKQDRDIFELFMSIILNTTGVYVKSYLSIVYWEYRKE